SITDDISINTINWKEVNHITKFIDSYKPYDPPRVIRISRSEDNSCEYGGSDYECNFGSGV
ncbi:MAG: hypothetical protein WCE81_00610, partial [Halobacteriota archaeon]